MRARGGVEVLVEQVHGEEPLVGDGALEGADDLAEARRAGARWATAFDTSRWRRVTRCFSSARPARSCVDWKATQR